MAARRVVMGLAGVVVALNLGCNPCKPFDLRPEEVCVPASSVPACP